MRERKQIVKLKNGDKIELIKLDQLAPKEKKEYANILIEISKSAGQDPKEHVYDRLDIAKLIILIKSVNNNHFVGFSVAAIPLKNVLHIAATMVIPEYQKKGLATIVTKEFIKYFLNYRLKTGIFGVLNTFQTFYILFRTQSPLLYSKFHKRGLSLYPNIKNKAKLTKEIINIASDCSAKLWPYATFDKENFVLKNAYKLHPFLIIKPENIPWSKNEEIDIFFQEQLKLDSESADALVLIVKINFLNLLKIL